MVNTILKEADLFCPNSVRINFTIYPNTKYTPTLSTLPLVLFPWNYKRISSSIKYIANSNNPFSIEESNGNVINVYFYPLGIALCERGNHSQLSAKLKGVGETSIERIMNIEHVYDHVNYDGIYFYHIFSENEETNPYRFKAQNRTEFLAGIIFEIGRLLKNYPELFPEEIKFAINNKEKIKQ